MKKLLFIFSSLIISCGDDSVTPMLTLDQKNIYYLPNGGETEIKVDTNIPDWYYSIQKEDNDWVEGIKTGNILKLRVLSHFIDDDDRSSVIRIYAGNEVQVININQTSGYNALKLNETNFTVPASGETIEFTVNSIVDYTIKIADEVKWINLLDKETIMEGEVKYRFVIDPYKNEQEDRISKIYVVGKGDYSGLEREIIVNQERYTSN